MLRQFTQRQDIVFVRHAAQVPEGATLLLWGAAVGPAGLGAGVKVLRLEDGFLRSVGLGADLTRPMSWVIDPLGIYFDARQPSALERMLQNAVFSPDLLERAAHFRQLVVAAGLSKYNLAAAPWHRHDTPRPVLLVPGQVETDASIATGAVDIRTNMALLQAVRVDRPDAWLVYKPHPDVVGYAHRDHANRVGHWRMAEVMSKHGFPGSVSLSVALCQHHPEVVAATADQFPKIRLINPTEVLGTWDEITAKHFDADGILDQLLAEGR